MTALAALLALAAGPIADAPPRDAVVTAYCLQGRMRNGNHVHPGAAASITLPIGTRIRFTRPVLGRTVFTITDTGRLARNQIDVWTPDCAAAIRHGRQPRRYQIITPAARFTQRSSHARH